MVVTRGRGSNSDRRKDRLFYLRYIASELRRRKGRTLLTALGLAVGIGLVVTVTALSTGLDRAQSKVLSPLTGVGTDMSVTRPLRATGSGSTQSFRPGPGGPGLSSSEQQQLRKENGGARFGLRALGKPGQRFSNDNFVSTQLSFPAAETAKVAKLDGVSSAAGALTLNSIHVSGRVPKRAQAGAFAAPAGGQPGPPNNIDLRQSTVSGVDTTKPDLGLVTPGQVRQGSYFTSATRRQAILSEGYARRQQLSVGDTFDLAKKRYRVVGISKPPLGGQASDIYIPLGQLQKLSKHEGRVNVIQVRATNADRVDSVATAIRGSFAGARVTTAKDLADRVSGSLVDAKNLASKLGTALAIVALAAAFLIASLLTLSSVNKRVRELGTLKALGWSQRLVVRQISGESLVQGALGGVLGALLGVGGAALVSAFAPKLEATVATAAPSFGPAGFGQGAISSGTSSVTLTAPVDFGLIALAVGLALLGGLLAGTIGGTRAARLRPAEALRSVE